MKLLFLLIVFSFCSHNVTVSQASLSIHKEVLLLMGTRFELTAMATDELIAIEAVRQGIEEIQRIEDLISSWKTASQTSEINRNAGIKETKVDRELYDLISRTKKISELTEGRFDISFASIERLYEFDKKERSLPAEEDCQSSIVKINYKDIILNEQGPAVLLKKKGMKIGFGGIGKGYAANRAKLIMNSIDGVRGGVVNAAGDLISWGENENPKGWPVQISDPKNIKRTLGWLYIKDMSVVTSGDYEKYFTSEGKRYSHIINPQTGLPTTGIKSATVISKDAEINDAIATSLFVMGKEKAIAFVNRLKGVEALIVTDDDELLQSKNLILNKY